MKFFFHQIIVSTKQTKNQVFAASESYTLSFPTLKKPPQHDVDESSEIQFVEGSFWIAGCENVNIYLPNVQSTNVEILNVNRENVQM